MDEGKWIRKKLDDRECGGRNKSMMQSRQDKTLERRKRLDDTKRVWKE